MNDSPLASDVSGTIDVNNSGTSSAVSSSRVGSEVEVEGSDAMESGDGLVAGLAEKADRGSEAPPNTRMRQ